MAEPLLLAIQCKTCGWWCNATDGTAPNDPNILACNCCTQWHDHDKAAEETGTPCRPITITLLSPIALQAPRGGPQASVFTDDMTPDRQAGGTPQWQ